MLARDLFVLGRTVVGLADRARRGDASAGDGDRGSCAGGDGTDAGGGVGGDAAAAAAGGVGGGGDGGGADAGDAGAGTDAAGAGAGAGAGASAGTAMLSMFAARDFRAFIAALVVVVRGFSNDGSFSSKAFCCFKNLSCRAEESLWK